MAISVGANARPRGQRWAISNQSLTHWVAWHLDEVARMADRILLLHHGQILGGLDPHGADVEHQFFQRLLEADRAEQRPR